MAQVILVARPLPKWLTIRYSVLWKEFGNKPFTYDDARKTLNEKDTLVIVVLSTLKKMGWVDVMKNPDDKRTRIYKLIDPEKAIHLIANSKDK